MGTNFFKSMKTPRIGANSTNMEARAISAPGYMARAAGGAAQKDLAAASVYKGNNWKGPTGTSAKAAPGPKKV